MFLNTALLVLKKDFDIELKSREIVYTTLLFALACILIFSLTFVVEGQPLAEAVRPDERTREEVEGLVAARGALKGSPDLRAARLLGGGRHPRSGGSLVAPFCSGRQVHTVGTYSRYAHIPSVCKPRSR